MRVRPPHISICNNGWMSSLINIISCTHNFWTVKLSKMRFKASDMSAIKPSVLTANIFHCYLQVMASPTFELLSFLTELISFGSNCCTISLIKCMLIWATSMSMGHIKGIHEPIIFFISNSWYWSTLVPICILGGTCINLWWTEAWLTRFVWCKHSF